MVEDNKRWWIDEDSSSVYIDTQEEDSIAEWNVSQLVEKD